MLHDPAWKDLKPGAKVLYLSCKDQWYHEKPAIPDDPLTFYMNQAKWADEYNLYKRSNFKGFARDMEALISHGFITCVYDGAIAKKKSIYRFSDEWKRYGQPSFKVRENEKTVAMKGTRKGIKAETQQRTPPKDEKTPVKKRITRDVFADIDEPITPPPCGLESVDTLDKSLED